MKITEIRTIPLFGETPMTGWTVEPGPDENMHTLVEVQIGSGRSMPKYHWRKRTFYRIGK